MITVNLTINQLAEAVRNLDATEKEQLMHLIDDDKDFVLTKEQQNILLERQASYRRGEMKTLTIEELKTRLNYSAD